MHCHHCSLDAALAMVLFVLPLFQAFSSTGRPPLNIMRKAPTLLPGKPQKAVRSKTSLFGMPKEFRPESEEEEEDSDDSVGNVEEARQQLEAMLADGQGNSKNTTSSSAEEMTALDIAQLIDPKHAFLDLPPPPPLTTIERERRESELKLLEALQDGDEAQASLWNLWYSERGPQAQKQLEKADQLMSIDQAESEQVLFGLIREYGIYFVEPLNRLATLYYLQQRFEESFKLCRVILTLKPWHFGALAGIVGVSIALGDHDGARQWADRRLPTLVASTSFPPFETKVGATNPRRAEWVQTAIQAAQDLLQRAQRETQQQFLGSPEDYYKSSKKNQSISDDGGTSSDAWQ